MLTDNDKSLIKQMIAAGRFPTIADLVAQYNEQHSKELIKAMGEKYLCHPVNRVKKLEVPLSQLEEHMKERLSNV